MNAVEVMIHEGNIRIILTRSLAWEEINVAQAEGLINELTEAIEPAKKIRANVIRETESRIALLKNDHPF